MVGGGDVGMGPWEMGRFSQIDVGKRRDMLLEGGGASSGTSLCLSEGKVMGHSN